MILKISQTDEVLDFLILHDLVKYNSIFGYHKGWIYNDRFTIKNYDMLIENILDHLIYLQDKYDSIPSLITIPTNNDEPQIEEVDYIKVKNPFHPDRRDLIAETFLNR